MGLLIRFTPDMYMIEALIMKLPTAETSLDLLAQWIWLNKLNAAYAMLTWTTLFSVKFSFLSFFRRLIKGLPEKMIYWWIVTVITTVVWAFGVVIVFLPCPYFSLRSCKLHTVFRILSSALILYVVQCAQSSELPRAIAFATTATVLDIVTDILSLSRFWHHNDAPFDSTLTVHPLAMVIPIRILWQIQMKISQKLILGSFLCLSIMMIIAALICISRIRTSTNSVDVTWENFWQMVETCVAVNMVSLNAFRTLFVVHRSRQKDSPNEAWYSWNRRVAFRKRRTGVEYEDIELPDISQATLTGMGIFVADGRSETERIAMSTEISFKETNSRRESEGNEEAQQETLRKPETVSTTWHESPADQSNLLIIGR